MKILKEAHLCDRCFKETEKIEVEVNSIYRYELCEECDKEYKKFEKSVLKLEQKYKNICKNFKFGEFLPKMPDEIKEKYK